ncbi:type IV pilus biogenesis protein PilP [Desulfovibrio sp. TomC]|uniref:type IV pilus biogenesis protein PilP n=1 Tax=Desulfovibrio sp. TomC TaxID=1562888 RepID=UPI0018CE5F75|nr:type IV pilus biogenesis protein PilP [Desulfovibrio sp. TomC]
MSQQSNRRRVLWLLGCGMATLGLVLVGVWVLWGWQEVDLPSPAKLPPKSQTKEVASVSAPAPVRSTAPSPLTPASKETQAKESEIPPFTVAAAIADSVPKSGNLEQMTSLRAELDEVRLQVAIAQEKEKLLPKQPSPVPHQTAILSELPKPVAAAQPRQASPLVVSIQGADGYTSATIRSSAGTLMTVRPGDKFGGGVITAINRTGVLVRRGNASTALAFE